MRTYEICRKTAETDISLTLNLDGTGKSTIDTGCGFLNHMLTLFAAHGKFDLTVKCVGDTEVDDHHSAEDIGIVLGLGLPLIGGFRLTATSTLVTFFFCSLATMVSLTALMLAVAMLIPNKAVGAIVAMLLGLALLMGAMTIEQILDAPEMIESIVGIDEMGELILSEPHPNPKYPSGLWRGILELLDRMLPGGQLMTIGWSETLPQNAWQLPVYSALFTALTTLGGAWGFCRRDLK